MTTVCSGRELPPNSGGSGGSESGDSGGSSSGSGGSGGSSSGGSGSGGGGVEMSDALLEAVQQTTVFGYAYTALYNDSLWAKTGMGECEG
jgi:hypothetical protein